MTTPTQNDAHGRDLVAYELMVSNLTAELAAENQAAGYWMREANASHNQNERLTAERDEYAKAADSMAAAHKVDRDALAERVKALEAKTLTHDAIRAAGGIVHKDGNIFFTNIDKLNAAIKGATT